MIEYLKKNNRRNKKRLMPKNKFRQETHLE